jgi:hypothetical protein
MIRRPLGRATPDVHAAFAAAHEATSSHGLVVKFVDADGQTGYDNSHQSFSLNRISTALMRVCLALCRMYRER